VIAGGAEIILRGTCRTPGVRSTRVLDGESTTMRAAQET
jgi:hypothetical protein